MALDKHILGMGTVVLDQQVFMEFYPPWDTKRDIQQSRIQVGGPVPTALALLSRWGLNCSFSGKWSDDPGGRSIEKNLTAENINLKPSVIPKNHSSGFAHVWVETTTGKRTIATSRGSFGPLTQKELMGIELPHPLNLHLDGWSAEAGVFLAKQIKAKGGQVFMDAGSPKPGYSELLPWVDVLICPERFAALYFPNDDRDHAAEKLMAMGINTIVFTQGANPLHLYKKNVHLIQPTYPIEAKDTTGAGDIFCGAFIYASIHNMPDKDALKFAASAAAIKCSRIGNREALPSLSEVRALVK